LDVVKYLVNSGYFDNDDIQDRWGNTPLDDAERGNFTDVANFLNNI
jgi:hypothetical protein